VLPRGSAGCTLPFSPQYTLPPRLKGRPSVSAFFFDTRHGPSSVRWVCCFVPTASMAASSRVLVVLGLVLASMASLAAARPGELPPLISLINVRATTIAIDDSISLTVNASVVENGDFVTVSWSGVPDPSDGDWVGVYSPSTTDMTNHYPIKFQVCSTLLLCVVTAGAFHRVGGLDGALLVLGLLLEVIVTWRVSLVLLFSLPTTQLATEPPEAVRSSSRC